MIDAYLLRCIQLAKLADSSTFPNPKVGAVIVHNNQIIGEGYHAYAGGKHAEVAAVDTVQDKSLLSQSTLYVSLEPCNHTGKTPPCTDLILQHKIPKVVIGCLDPNPQVAGTGVERLRNAGVEVVICPNPAPFQLLNKIFFVNQLERRPFIALKWAESWDGFLARENSQGQLESTQITQAAAKAYTHSLRATHHAIMIGANTAKIDNPQLTVRYFTGKNPIRIVMDRELVVPQDLRIFTDEEAPTIVVNNSRYEVNEGVSYYRPSTPDSFDDIKMLVTDLYENLNICSILVEGGTNLLQQFIDADYFDEIYRFRGNTVIRKGLAAPVLPRHFIWKEEKRLGNDTLKVFERNTKR